MLPPWMRSQTQWVLTAELMSFRGELGNKSSPWGRFWATEKDSCAKAKRVTPALRHIRHLQSPQCSWLPPLISRSQDREAERLWLEPSDTMSQNKYFPKLFLSVFGHHYAKVTKTPSYCLSNLETGLSPSHTITDCLKPRCGDLTPLGKSKQTSLREGLLC